jgi:hypothetical protein
MLDQCAAYLIARNESHTTALERLALRLGFGHVEPLYSRKTFQPDASHPALKFFLMYRHMDERLMTTVRDVIRASSDPNVRFAPIVLFAEECDFESYLRFVKMGFDDVLTLPDKREMLVKRLEGQINADHVYFETDTYLGPDRRRMEAPGHTDPRRGGEQQSRIKHTIHRTVVGGSAAIRTEYFSAANSSETARVARA